MLKCRVFGGKTGPFPVGLVFGVVRSIAMVRFRVEPEPEPTREFGPVANTTNKWLDVGFQLQRNMNTIVVLILII